MMSTLATPSHLPDAPLDVGVLIGLDKGEDGADLARLVVPLVVRRAASTAQRH